MTVIAVDYLKHKGGFSEPTERKIATKLKVRWVDFLRPLHFFDVGRIDTDQAFEVFRWMMATGEEYSGYGKSGVWETLSLSPTCINFHRVDTFGAEWRKDLQKRFVAAILEDWAPPRVDRWRKAYSVTPTGERIVPIRYVKDGVARYVGKTLDALFECAERKTRRSLNSCHPKARTVFFVELCAWPSGYVVSFSYGYARDRGSMWNEEVAKQKDKELFADFIERALNRLDGMLLKGKGGT